MAARKRYLLDRVAVGSGEARPATWTFAGAGGRVPVTGTEYLYAVIDGNFPARNVWEFVVRAPAAASEPIEVRPRSAPNLKAWAELPNRSLTFPRATRGDARGKRYCKVSLADPTGARTKDLVRGDERHDLPAWFEPLRSRMRLKQNVRPTRGTDGESLVVLVPPDDHAAMIRLFFATKVWVLKERVALA
jgi:hypothetical protein